MKNIYLFMLVLALGVNCAFGQTTSKTRTFVFDNEQVLTTQEEAKLDSLFLAHEKKTTNEIALVTVAEYGEGKDLVQFSVDFANKLGLGKADKNNGVLIVFSKTLRETRIATGRGTEKVLTDEIAKQFIDSLMLPKFREGQYFDGLFEGGKAIVEFLERPENKID